MSLIQAQKNRLILCTYHLLFRIRRRYSASKFASPTSRTHPQCRNTILIRNAYLEAKHERHREVNLIVMPHSLVPHIVEVIHSAPQAGHPGKDRCLHQARMKYYWPTMSKDIHAYIDKCRTCAVNKGLIGKPVKILSYPTPLEPWDTLAIDLLELPTSSEGHQYLLVAIDHFNCCSILVPLKDKKSTSVATSLIDEVFCKFTTPKVRLSGNGTEIDNNILSEICKQFDIKKTNIIAYQPALNGGEKRQNRIIINHPRTLVGSNSHA